jgi:outer membrane lipoprotein-sorting protein
MTRHRAFFGACVLALSGCLAMTQASAQTQLPAPPTAAAPATDVTPAKPKPKPKPKPKTPLALDKKAPAPAVAAPAAAAPIPRPPADVGTAAPLPSPPPSNAPLSKSAEALDLRQRAIVERVSNYLTSLRTLVGAFKQVAPDGSQSQGEFYLLRPGRVRFEYADPSPVLLVADGRSVIVRDRNLATQDEYAISQTPLRFLLADRVDLLRDTNIVAVYGDNVFNTIVIEEKQIVRGKYRVMLMFDAQRGQLRQWVVTDPQGLDTTVAVFNLDTTTKPDPELFKIDRTRYVQ